MQEAGGDCAEPGAGDHAALNPHVVQMFFFQVCRGLDLDQSPAVVLAALQDIDPNECTAVLECALEDRGYRRVRDQLPRGSDCLVQSSGTVNFHAARKKLAGEQSDLVTLFHE